MHTCRHCNRSFATELSLELHHDTCERGQLYCHDCGAQFTEAAATRDGWHYTCPSEDCESTGLGEGIGRIEDATISPP